MNNKQRKICWGALVLFCLSLLFVPVVRYNNIWWIPFFSIDALQKVRIDILSIEWIGIAAIAFTLCILQNEKKEIDPPPIEKVRKKSGFWKFAKWLFLTLVIIALIIASILLKNDWDKKQDDIKKEQFKRSCISKAEAFLSDVKLDLNVYDRSKRNYVLTGSVQNLSKKYKLVGLRIKVLIIDVLLNGKVEVMASEYVDAVDGLQQGAGYNDQIPPAQSCKFRKQVSFGNLPLPYGKMNWTYELTDIIGESDDQINGDPSIQRAKPFPVSKSLFDDLLEDTNSKTSNDPFADLPDKKSNGKK